MIPHSRPWLTADEHAAVAAALDSHMVGQGAQTAAFEAEVAAWVGARAGVAVASGAAALVLALRALDIGAGDEVILPSYVCVSVLEAVCTAGATPVLCDVGPDWVVTPDCLAARRGPRTRAAIVPHLYGLYADVDGCRALGLPIIEDCAQALGDRRQSVLRGDIAVLSFHPTKCLTTGEGGMCLTADAGLARRLRALRDGEATRPGWRCPAPMSDLASALGRAQFSRYGEMLARRRVLAAAYDVALAELPGIDLRPALLATGMYFRYVLHRPGGVEAVAAAFAEHGVAVRRGVDALLHRRLGLEDQDFPMSVRHFDTTVSLPLYPGLDDTEAAHCVATARAVLAAG